MSDVHKDAPITSSSSTAKPMASHHRTRSDSGPVRTAMDTVQIHHSSADHSEVDSSVPSSQPSQVSNSLPLPPPSQKQQQQQQHFAASSPFTMSQFAAALPQMGSQRPVSNMVLGSRYGNQIAAGLLGPTGFYGVPPHPHQHQHHGVPQGGGMHGSRLQQTQPATYYHTGLMAAGGGVSSGGAGSFYYGASYPSHPDVQFIPPHIYPHHQHQDYRFYGHTGNHHHHNHHYHHHNHHPHSHNRHTLHYRQHHSLLPQTSAVGHHGTTNNAVALQGKANDVSMSHTNGRGHAAKSTPSGAVPTAESQKGNVMAMVRGPPRKPRQSGHAIWIGNLPPQTDLMELVQHVCREASGLESLFLISKSNCAFANFRNESTCIAAQQKLHDSEFRGMRLVSRMRKSTVEGLAGKIAPTGPASTISGTGAGSHRQGPVKAEKPVGSAAANEQNARAGKREDTAPESAHTVEPHQDEGGDKAPNVPLPSERGQTSRDDKQVQAAQPPPQHKDRFFILKSLTVEDLELSVRTGAWATQAHNEEVLNNAFKTSEAVYLIFSANKSREYFGYARMTSEISSHSSAAPLATPAAAAATSSTAAGDTTEPKPLAGAGAGDRVMGIDMDSSAGVGLAGPRAIPTQPTEFVPRGRIIDDSARGTIFWEAETSTSTGAANRQSKDEGNSPSSGKDTSKDGTEVESTEQKQDQAATTSTDDEMERKAAWGKPFSLTWLSTTRLPFPRTRGLLNPWNSNRDIKIARDGTEIEPTVARHLLGLFNSRNNPAATTGNSLPYPHQHAQPTPQLVHGGLSFQGHVPPSSHSHLHPLPVPQMAVSASNMMPGAVGMDMSGGVGGMGVPVIMGGGMTGTGDASIGVLGPTRGGPQPRTQGPGMATSYAGPPYPEHPEI